LVACVVGCGGKDDAEPAPDLFSEKAARAAYRAFLTAETPQEYCALMTRRAEAQIVDPLAAESFPDADSCPEAARAISKSHARFELGDPLTPEARRALRRTPELDREAQTAAFLDRFRAGVVLRLIDGEWRVIGIATGG
jgi:hypothetical protein